MPNIRLGIEVIAIVVAVFHNVVVQADCCFDWLDSILVVLKDGASEDTEPACKDSECILNDSSCSGEPKNLIETSLA